MVKPFAVALAASLVLVGGLLSPARAQGRWVRLDGAVQWIAADKMLLITDGGSGIAIDLTKVPLDQYMGLGPGDRVTVDGMVAPDNRKVFGTSITRARYGGTQSP
jgi:hypothetical protein